MTLLLLLLFALLAMGCNSKNAALPVTHPVEGKVVQAGSPINGGLIQFRSKTDPNLSASGTIAEDGSFKLSTIVDGTKIPGAPEGSYEVMVVPAMGADQAARPVTLPKPYQVEAKDNRFDLSLDAE
jgi:hypothetical protein